MEPQQNLEENFLTATRQLAAAIKKNREARQIFEDAKALYEQAHKEMQKVQGEFDKAKRAYMGFDVPAEPGRCPICNTIGKYHSPKCPNYRETPK